MKKRVLTYLLLISIIFLLLYPLVNLQSYITEPVVLFLIGSGLIGLGSFGRWISRKEKLN